MSASPAWGPADRCHRHDCGAPGAGCFHWPGLPVDRSADALTNARYGAPVATAPVATRRAPASPPLEPMRPAELDAFSLSPSVSDRARAKISRARLPRRR